MVKISGAKLHTDRLKKMSGARTKSLTDKALYAAGSLIQVEAQISITTGAIQGAGHIPSAPYDPPNANTGELHNNIFTVPVGRGRVNVEAIAPHAKYMEFGTSRVIERPFMNPASQKKSPEAKKLVAEAIRRSTK